MTTPRTAHPWAIRAGGRVTQLSFVPDNDRERVLARPSVPVAKLIDGRWCWKRFGEDVWIHEPELERILLTRK